MTTGSYLLARFSNRDDLVPAAHLLDSIDSVSRWDAVDGYFSLVIKLRSSDVPGIEQVRNLDGLCELKRCDIISDNEPALGDSVAPSRSYAFLETDRGKRDDIASLLSSMAEIGFCSPTTGDCDLVAVVTGLNFDDVDRTISEKIRPLDGVLRVKTDRIIDLDSM